MGGGWSRPGWTGPTRSPCDLVHAGLYFEAPLNRGEYGSGWYGPSGFTYEQEEALTTIVSSSSITGLDVTLPSAVYIKGVITNSAGKRPVVQVTFFRDGEYVGYAQNDSFGYWAALPPGDYVMGVNDENGVYGAGWFGQTGFTTDAAAAEDGHSGGERRHA